MRDYDWGLCNDEWVYFYIFVFALLYVQEIMTGAGAMMNGCINKAGTIQGHAGHQLDLCFFSWNFGNIFQRYFFSRVGILTILKTVPQYIELDFKIGLKL